MESTSGFESKGFADCRFAMKKLKIQSLSQFKESGDAFYLSHNEMVFDSEKKQTTQFRDGQYQMQTSENQVLIEKGPVISPIGLIFGILNIFCKFN